jgi:1-acyl-sn-glycerol-3-phosphate acyltransferase
VIDLALYDRLHLKPRNCTEWSIASLVIRPNYLISGVRLDLQGLERLPKAGDETLIVAMNHTDRYNYLPIMEYLFRHPEWPRLAAWVKGKYFRSRAVAWALLATNNIPLPSTGHTLEELYRAHFRHPIPSQLYRPVRDVIDGRRRLDDPKLDPRAREALQTPVHAPDVAGRRPLLETVREQLQVTMDRCLDFTLRAMDTHHLHLIVFPEGTRSVQLGIGRIGLIQFALAMGRRVLPVGCSGSDLVYPYNLPIARPGTVTYRFGEPYDPRDLLEPGEIGPFTPFTSQAEAYRPTFERLTFDLMCRLNVLLDPRHQSPRYAPSNC